MKTHAVVRTAIFAVLAALTFWWAHENATDVGRVAPWSLEFFKGIGACAALVFCIFHVTRGGLQKDLEDLVPRSPWHKAHALKSRIKRLERSSRLLVRSKPRRSPRPEAASTRSRLHRATSLPKPPPTIGTSLPPDCRHQTRGWTPHGLHPFCISSKI